MPVDIFMEGKVFIAYTPAFDLTTQGSSVAEAKYNLREAMELWVESCRKMGTLEQALAELGWNVRKAKYAPPKVVERTEELIFLPA